MLFMGRVGGARAVFSFCDLSGVSVAGRNLSDADFTGAILADCNLAGTKLERSIFFCADLRRANLSRASLRRADLRGACLRGAFMVGADLFESDLREGSIAERDASGNLTFMHHKLQPSEMQAVVLANANLERARMSGIIAIQADFTDAVMRSCKLVRANLRQSKLTGANLEGADLSGADLKGANLSGAILVKTKMNMAVTDNADMTDVLTDAPAGKPLSDLVPSIEDRLQAHERWCDSQGREGSPLVISGYDLRSLKSLASANLTAMRAPLCVFYGLDLAGIQLQGAQLQGADLRATNLSGADLRGVNLTDAKLTNADLRDCNLGALLIAEDRILPTLLDGAVLRYADLRGVDLHHTSLKGADISYSNMIGAKMRAADFTDSKLDTTLFSRGAMADAVSLGCKGLPVSDTSAPGH